MNLYYGWKWHFNQIKLLDIIETKYFKRIFVFKAEIIELLSLEKFKLQESFQLIPVKNLT